MYLQLFWKECRQNMKSMTYVLYVCCLILFFVTQLQDIDGISKPQPGQKKYGEMLSNDEEVRMECALTELFYSYQRNSYPTYPLGFYKNVQTDEEEQEMVKETLERLTGRTIEELEKDAESYQEKVTEALEGQSEENIWEVDSFKIMPDKAVSYETFLEEMKKIDVMLGGGSRFSEQRIKSEAKEEMSYEQAKEEYQKVIEKDKVSGAYARLFCDYFGILLAILPVFLAVTRAVRDKRAKAQEVIASKEISSVGLILTRYFAIVTAAMIPVLILSISPAMQASYVAKSLGASGDFLLYGKYLAGWLLPSVLFSVSAGFFFTELAGGAFAILVMGMYWLISLFQSAYQLTGSVGWNLIPRFNSLGQRGIYEAVFNELAANRIFYTGLSFLLIAAAILIYDKKRKGRWGKNGKHH